MGKMGFNIIFRKIIEVPDITGRQGDHHMAEMVSVKRNIVFIDDLAAESEGGLGFFTAFGHKICG